jgi:CubicO group peptidase (beta-lactamase class C family)
VATKSIAQAIDACVETGMTQYDAPGAAVSVVLDGDVIYETGYGSKLQDTNDPVDAQTIFRIGPVGQQMVAAAVLQQVELGRVALDDPITDLVPEFQVSGEWPADTITVGDALTHATGFPDVIDTGTVQDQGALSRWASRQDSRVLMAPPDALWNYSNPNYMLAGLIAERAGGLNYRQLLAEELWGPAGMSSTTFDPAEVRAHGNFANGHCWVCAVGSVVSVPPEENDLWDVGPAGMAFSTVGDLTRWALTMMDGGGPVLSSRSAALLQFPHRWTNTSPDRHMGLGVMIDTYQGLDLVEYAGSIRGFGAHLMWVPDRRFAVALLANATSTLSDTARCIVDSVLDPDPVDPVDPTTDQSTWTAYVGDYVMTESNGYQTFASVYFQGDQLKMSVVDPANPNVIFVSDLVQESWDTFLFDSNGDGDQNFDFTFCRRDGSPAPVWWMRNRSVVGERQPEPRTVTRVVRQ